MHLIWEIEAPSFNPFIVQEFLSSHLGSEVSMWRPTRLQSTTSDTFSSQHEHGRTKDWTSFKAVPFSSGISSWPSRRSWFSHLWGGSPAWPSVTTYRRAPWQGLCHEFKARNLGTRWRSRCGLWAQGLFSLWVNSSAGPQSKAELPSLSGLEHEIRAIATFLSYHEGAALRDVISIQETTPKWSTNGVDVIQLWLDLLLPLLGLSI